MANSRDVKQQRLRDLPVKTIYIRGLAGPIPIEAHIIEAVYDHAAGTLYILALPRRDGRAGLK